MGFLTYFDNYVLGNFERQKEKQEVAQVFNITIDPFYFYFLYFLLWWQNI